MKRTYAVMALLIVSLAFAACGGGGSSLPPSPTTAPKATAPPTTSPTATPVATATPDTQSVAVTSAPTSAPLPPDGGFSGTMNFPSSNANGSVQLTITTSVASPSGLAPMLARAPQSLPANANPLLWVQVTSPVSLTFNAIPSLQIAMPSSVTTSGLEFYIATYDGQSWIEPAMGPAAVTGSSVTFYGAATQLVLQANVTYTLVLYSVPASTPTPTPTPTPIPSATPAISEYPIPTGTANADDIITGPDNNLWFTELEGFKIAKITTSGAITEYAVGTPGAIPSQPAGIAAGPDGNLWWTDEGTNAIGVLTTSGAMVTEYPVTSIPRSIVKGPDGNLWFTEGNCCTSPPQALVGKITTNGQITTYATAHQPFDIVVGSDNNLWFLESDLNQQTGVTTDAIGKMTPSGTLTEYPISVHPFHLSSGPDGNLWITYLDAATYPSTHGIAKIGLSGAVTTYPVTSGQPWGITSGPGGVLWFTDDSGDKIGSITTSGAITEYPGPPGGYPSIITEGPDNNLWFTDVDNSIGKVVP